jgi:DNA replication protein DnaD
MSKDNATDKTTGFHFTIAGHIDVSTNTVRKIKHIETVLLNWHQYGIKTVEQCEAYLKEREEKRRDGKDGTGHPVKDNSAGEEIQNRYDFSKSSEV